jgi:hypothetical protein
VKNLATKEPVETQNTFFLQEIHELTMLCLQACCRDEAQRIKSSAISIQTHTTPFFSHGQRLQDNIFDSL